VASNHGVYVPLTRSGALALVSNQGQGSAVRVDIGEGRVAELSVAPDNETVVAFSERYACDHEGDGKAPTELEDCDSDSVVVTTELNVVAGAKIASTVEMVGTFNAISYSDDGSFAIAYLDFDDPDLQLDGVISLTSVVVLDLAKGVSTPVGVGFAADRVLFVNGGSGAPERAVVLSQNQVAVVDLLPEVPEKVVTFPLTLDPDTVVTPVGVELTPDGQYALISVENRSDLYVLDLLNESINIVELSNDPSDMIVNPTEDRTVLVYGNGAMVDVLEHEFFDIDTFSLDEPMNRLHNGSDFAVMYSTGSEHDAYRLDLKTSVLTEYRLQNPAVSMHVAPTEEFAIALTRAENGFTEEGVDSLYDASPGMEILDLSTDDTQPFLLEGLGLGVAWASTEATLHALVLQTGADYLYQLDMYTGRAEELDLDAPASSIGSLPDGSFFISHDSPLGLITFLDPASGNTIEVAGFATLGIVDAIELQLTGEEE
jgi:hypothetical protein